MTLGIKYNINTKKYKYILLNTVILFMVAHGYRFLNNLYTADALVEVFQDDIYWQRSLGRFLQPLTMVMRGSICAPWLIGCIAILFLSISFYLISDILDITRPIYLTLLVAVCICNETMTSSIACFLPWVDIYGVALFLAALGAWLYKRDTVRGYILGSISFVCSMAFYQAYIDVAIALLLFSIISMILYKTKTKDIIITSIKYFLGLLCSAVTYYISYNVICKLHHVEISTTYNGLSELGDYQNTSVIELITKAYTSVFTTLLSPSVFSSTYLLGRSISSMWEIILKVSVILSILLIVTGLIYIAKINKLGITEIVLLFMVLAIMPFCINLVFFLSKGMEHSLMTYSFYMIFILLIYVIQTASKKSVKNKWMPVLFIPVALLIWNSIVLSNQMYFKIDMEDRAAESYATRLIHDIEGTDSYEYGVTPVAIIGSMDKSTYIQEVPYLRDINVYGNWKSPCTYDMSMDVYLNVYLNAYLNITSIDETSDAIANMPIYPAKGSIQYIDDVLVVKVSELTL